MTIHTVGAWCGPKALANPKDTVKFAVAHSIDRLDIMVNDHSKFREPHRFSDRTYQSEKVIGLASHANTAGLSVHLTSWIMPHERYIEAAANYLIPLARNTLAQSLILDAEEPWTQAKQRMRYADAVSCFADHFEKLPCQVGLTGIGYASIDKLGPLADVCRYGVPQAYATNRVGGLQLDRIDDVIRRWKAAFPSLEIVAGLAAYRQDGQDDIPGAGSEIRTAASLAASEGCDTVIYWSMRHIQANPDVARAIAGIKTSAGA